MPLETIEQVRAAVAKGQHIGSLNEASDAIGVLFRYFEGLHDKRSKEIDALERAKIDLGKRVTQLEAEILQLKGQSGRT